MDETNEVIEIIDGEELEAISTDSTASIELTDLATKIMSEVSFAQNRICMMPKDQQGPAIEDLEEQLRALLNKIKEV